MPLSEIDGTKTKEFIMILGMDSPIVRAARADGYRLILECKDKEVGRVESVNNMRAAMIESWSFPDECTHDEKLDLLINAPYIGDSIDLFCSNNENFKQKK